MPAKKKLGYVVDLKGYDYALNLREVDNNDESAMQSFQEGKRLMLAVYADLVTHYQIQYAAWSDMTQEEWSRQKLTPSIKRKY
jgi:hypothetical protein